MSLRLFWHVVSTEARTQMSYRVDFWLNAVVSFVAQIVLMYFLWQAMFSESGATRIGASVIIAPPRSSSGHFLTEPSL